MLRSRAHSATCRAVRASPDVCSPGSKAKAFDPDAGTIVAEAASRPVNRWSSSIRSSSRRRSRREPRSRRSARVGSRECAEFDPGLGAIVVQSPVDFDNDESVLRLFCDDVVTRACASRSRYARPTPAPAMRNTSRSRSIAARFGYAPGSAHVDGSRSATTQSPRPPSASAQCLPQAAVESVSPPPPPFRKATTTRFRSPRRWKGGSRAFARMLHVRVSPRFTAPRNYIEATRHRARARRRAASPCTCTTTAPPPNATSACA